MPPNTVVATVSLGEFPEGIAITIGPVRVTDVGAIPTVYTLSQNYPNPFNPTTTINYKIPELSFVTLKVYDVLGSEVATIANEEKPAGNYDVEFDGSVLTSGIYFYRIQVGDYTNTKKMILLK